MPRVGLSTADVVAAAAAMADEDGYGAVALAPLAARLGVKPPALYKHVKNLGDLRHRIAALAMAELAEVLRDALQGKAGRRRWRRCSPRSASTSPRTPAGTAPPSARSS